MKIPPILPSEAWQNVRVFAEGLAKEPLYAFLGFVCLLVFLFALVSAILLAFAGSVGWTILVLFAAFAFLICALLWRAPTIIRIGTESKVAEAPRRYPDDASTAMTGDPLALTDAKRQFVCQLLEGMVRNAGLSLHIDTWRLRSNVFLPDETGVLTIPPGLHHNMHNERELTLRIKPGTGCSGRAYEDRTHKVAIFREGWGKYELEKQEREKVDRNLRWIISTPIPSIDSPDEPVGGIANVDCLHQTKEPHDLEPIVADLYYWARLIAEALSTGGTHHGA